MGLQVRCGVVCGGAVWCDVVRVRVRGRACAERCRCCAVRAWACCCGAVRGGAVRRGVVGAARCGSLCGAVRCGAVRRGAVRDNGEQVWCGADAVRCV